LPLQLIKLREGHIVLMKITKHSRKAFQSGNLAMTWTNVHLTQADRDLLIKAAVLQKVSVEQLASQILAEAIQEKLKGVLLNNLPTDEVSKHPLAGLEPYAYNATPEELAFPSNQWNMEQQQT
jgi:hypothetical protein